jgi:pyruvate/2-oxoglutarate dehydrogenase complex dihydrolipoamide acyltransferase (E2) component
MAKIIGLPKLSPTMEEGTLVAWNKQEGDAVDVDDLLAEVETDKATMEFRSFDKGVLLKILAPVGSTLAPDKPVAIIGQAGEDISALIAKAGGGAAEAKPAAKTKTESKSESETETEPETETETESETESEDRVRGRDRGRGPGALQSARSAHGSRAGRGSAQRGWQRASWARDQARSGGLAEGRCEDGCRKGERASQGCCGGRRVVGAVAGSE